MNSGFAQRMCAAVVVGISVGPAPAAAAGGATGPTQDRPAIDFGDAAVSAMSRVELSQVTSNKATPRREAGVDNRVKLPAEDSAGSTKVKIESTGGFLIVDIRQSSGFANNQVNTAQIHAP